MAGGWDRAYLRQAKSDNDVFRSFTSMSVAQCHKLHYLQMATEKLAKALVSANNGGRCEDRGHRYIVKMIDLLLISTSSMVRSTFGFSSKSGYVDYLKTDVIPVATAIQNVYPVKRGGPNLEYPWEEDGAVKVPIDHCFNELELENDATKAFTDFVDKCFEKADDLLQLFASAGSAAGG